ncbi:hypothetical protein OQA88_2095 [Cercophora sp. LCS_1]
MATAQPWQWPIPRPLRQLFDAFPLVVHEATELPARSDPSNNSTIPTLYIFTTEDDARNGAPSHNPTCLKWQVSLPYPPLPSIRPQTDTQKTYLHLTKTPFKTHPSTNHASPTGALPFLLPLRQPESGTTNTPSKPLPSSSFLKTYPLPGTKEESDPRLEAYNSLLETPIRNLWLYTLYLDPQHTPLLDKFYVHPSSSSSLIRSSIRQSLRRAAEGEILKTGSYLSSAAAGTAVVDGERIESEGKAALEALEGLLNESKTGWFFGAEGPGEFDCGVFAYTELLARWVGRLEGYQRLEGHRKRLGGLCGWV